MYDIKAIKAIPVADVARKYGIELEKKHGRLWGKLRNEKTASFSINIAKNLWYDFGAGKGGSVIDLVAELDGISNTEAINKLAEEYNFKNEVTKGWHPLTDSQYRELGIIPEKATLNFDYDLRIHTPQQLARWNEKYGMSLSELADKHSDSYNKLVSKIGKDVINAIRDAYFKKVLLAVDPSIDKSHRELYKRWAEKDAEEINTKLDLLLRGIKSDLSILGTMRSLRVNPVNDFRNYELQNNGNNRVVSQDEEIREKVVRVYKKLFNYQQADYLSIDTAKVLLALNSAVSDSDNKFLAIQEIKDLYKMLGKNLQDFENEYSLVLKDGDSLQKGDNPQFKAWNIRIENLKRDIANVKELFKLCSSALTGLREANLAYKNDSIKHNSIDKQQEKSHQTEIS
jgi:hypothetical protein